MKLPIYCYGHPVLRNISTPVPQDYPDLQQLIADMFETLTFSEGVGLAAPQIGKNIRLVVVDATPLAEDFPDCADFKKPLINPEVEVLDGESVSRSEGCLSLPGISDDVPRVEHIHLRWLDADFKPHEQEISGFLARIVQHECDHLDGVLYIDHTSPIRRSLNKTKLSNIITGKVRVSYPVRFAPKKRK